jgi:hypothetical protein
MTKIPSVPALARILDGLAQEIAEAPEAELASVLAELGLRPEMKGSAALLELRGRLRSVTLPAGFCLDDLDMIASLVLADLDEPPEGGGAAGTPVPLFPWLPPGWPRRDGRD